MRSDAASLAAWTEALEARLGATRFVGAAHGPLTRWRGVAEGALAVDVELAPARVALRVPREHEGWAGLHVLPLALVLDTIGGVGLDDARLAAFAHVVCTDVGATRGLFDAAARAHLATLVEAGGAIVAGVVSLEVTLPAAGAGPSPVAALDAVLALGRRLGARPDDVRPKVIDPHVATFDRLPDAPDIETWAAFLGAPDAPSELVRKALVAMCERFEVEALARVTHAPWPSLMADPALGRVEAKLVAALRDDPAARLTPVLRLLRAIFGAELAAAPLSYGVADALAEALPLAPSREAGNTMLELARHPRSYVAQAGKRAFAVALPTIASIEAAFRTDAALHELRATPPCLAHALALAHAAFATPASDDDRAARIVLQRVLISGDPGGPELLRELGRGEACACIASHRAARDVGGVELLRGLLEHVAPDVRRAALAAILDIGEVDDARRAVAAALPFDLLAAAVDGPPRHGALALIRGFPDKAGESTRAQFLDALATVGSPDAAGFAAHMLDDESTTLALAAMRVLGACAGPDMIVRLRPYTGGLFRDAAIKIAARDAIEAITRRAAPRGALSMSLDDGGLALADDDERR